METVTGGCLEDKSDFAKRRQQLAPSVTTSFIRIGEDKKFATFGKLVLEGALHNRRGGDLSKGTINKLG